MTKSYNSFWEFSLSFYADSDVQRACIALQDSLGADVNIVLFMLYQATQGRQLSDDTINTINQSVTPWREQVIQPIRSARQHIKQHNSNLTNKQQSDFKAQLMATELQAEKLEQTMIESLELTWVSVAPEQAAHINLQHYACLLGSNSNADGFLTLLYYFNKNAPTIDSKAASTTS